MAFTRSLLTSGSQKTNAAITTASFSVSAGASLFVCVASMDTGLSAVWPSGATWNGQALTRQEGDSAGSFSSIVSLSVFALHNASAGTATASISPDASCDAVAYVVIQVTGFTGGGAVDQRKGAGSAGTALDSGLTPATTQANEYLLGLVGTNGPSGDTAGSWSDAGGGVAMSNGQRVGSTGGSQTSNVTLSEGFLEVSATGQYKAAKTGMTSRSGNAMIVTFTPPAGGAAGQPILMRFGGVPGMTPGQRQGRTW